MFQLHNVHNKVEVGSEDLSVVHIPLPKKGGSGPHDALAKLAAAGDTPLLVVRDLRGDCITIPSAAIHSVWPFPDALKIDAQQRVSLDLQDRAQLGALCETLATAGIGGLVTATPGGSQASVTVPVNDFPKVAAFLPALGLALGSTARTLSTDTTGGNVSKGKSIELDAKAAADAGSKREASPGGESRSSGKASRKNRKSSSSSSSSKKRSPSTKQRKFKERDKSKEKKKSRDRDRDKDKSRDRGKDKDRDKDKKKDKDKGRDKSRDRDRDKKRDKDRSRSRDRDRDKKKDKDRDKGKKDSKDKKSRSRSERAHHSPKRSKPARGGFDQKEQQMSSQLALVAAGMGLLPGMPNMMSLTADPEIEAFLAVNPVDQQAAARFRALPLELQRLVLVRGSLVGTRDPSAVLMSRVRDAMSGQGIVGGQPTGRQQQQQFVVGPPPGTPLNPQVEAFLSENPVGQEAGNRLRMLPPHIQRVVLIRGSLSSTRDPSSVLMSRIRDANGGGGGPSGMMSMSMPTMPPPPAATPYRAGDWMCPRCTFHNVSANKNCTQCGTGMSG